MLETQANPSSKHWSIYIIYLPLRQLQTRRRWRCASRWRARAAAPKSRWSRQPSRPPRSSCARPWVRARLAGPFLGKGMRWRYSQSGRRGNPAGSPRTAARTLRWSADRYDEEGSILVQPWSSGSRFCRLKGTPKRCLGKSRYNKELQ